MAITPNTTFTSGSVLTAAQQNNFPRGIMAVTTSTGNTITAGNLVGLSATFTAVANRNYKISLLISSNVTTTGRVIISYTGATNRPIDYTGPSGSFDILTGFDVRTFSAGSQTIQVTWTTVSGTIIANASAGAAHQLVIEDVGTA
jgi:hypothetical protein